MTLRALARAHGVPFETFRHRIKGSITRAFQHQLGKKTVLLLTCEKELAEHVKNLASVGFPCTLDDIRTLAYEYALRVGIKGFSDKKKKTGSEICREFIRSKSDEHESYTGVTVVYYV